MQELVAESKRYRCTRVIAIGRASQAMAEDERKEAMTEELIMEVVKEPRESREALCRMKKAHEREIRVIRGDKLKEYH